MRFVHGSRQDLGQDGRFKLFDYIFDSNEGPTGVIGSGKDQHGPGIYSFTANGAAYSDALRGAMTYAEDGYVYVLSMDIEEEDLANERPADDIEEELWINVIDKFIEMRCEAAGYEEERLRGVVEEFANNFDTGDRENLKGTLGRFKGLDWSFVNPSEFDNAEEWIDSVMDEYFVNANPCVNIYEEGGPGAIVEYAHAAADNLWETLTKIWDRCAVIGTGLGYETYNDTFQKAVKEVLGDQIKAALVENGQFGILFDTESITIEKVIPVNEMLNSSEQSL